MNRAANPVKLINSSWCTSGATGVERVEFMLLVECF
jgi:hypothetical protein